MDISDRIRSIIAANQLSAGAFADKIGVQRSNVSHVLSKRNKPSFEFLNKVVEAFPKVQSHWLLTGKQFQESQDSKELNIPITNVTLFNSSELDSESQSDDGFDKTEPKEINLELNTARKIIKIVQFYDNFTFDTYVPSEQ